MQSRRVKYLLVLALLLMTQPVLAQFAADGLVSPRRAGKPDPRWRSFDWQYVEAAADDNDFRLFFYEEERWAAQFTLPIIKEHVRSLSRTFDFTLPEEFTYILFSTQWEWRQANVFDVSEGVQGITATNEYTMAIPYWGDVETFRHISQHEMVHQFQVQKANELSEAHPELLAQIPLWFIEGMAEYYSLNGVDDETKAYIRDMRLHPRKGKFMEPAYEIPDLLKEGPLGFAQVYKVGQVKIDFFEREFGKNTVQEIYDAILKAKDGRMRTFADIVTKTLEVEEKELERRWRAYIAKVYTTEDLPQPLDDFELIEEAGETMDAFALSPDGALIATREIDPLTGVSSIVLLDVDRNYRRTVVTSDRKRRLVTLNFMQEPGLAISENRLAYVVGTTAGPELEYISIERDGNEGWRLGTKRRIPLHEMGILQAHSLALSPDQDQIAFVGLDRRSWENIYIADLDEDEDLVERVTDDHFSYVTLDWSERGLLVASNRHGNDDRDIFAMDLETYEFTPVIGTPADESSPSFANGVLYYRSDASGSSQLYTLEDERQERITGATTWIKSPKAANGNLYALALRSGYNRLFRIPAKRQLEITESRPLVANTRIWRNHAPRFSPETVKSYQPFATEGTRIDSLWLVLSGNQYGMLSGVFSDLMRNYTIAATASGASGFGLTDSAVSLTSRKGRASWTLGAYTMDQVLIDNVFIDDYFPGQYLHEESGALGAIQYPIGAYTYLEGGLSLGVVKRSKFTERGDRLEIWDELNPGLEQMIEPTIAFGHDEVVYEAFSGPIDGFSILAQYSHTTFPERNAFAPRARFDLGVYQPIIGRTLLALEGIAGATWGDIFRRPFYLYSDEILRAYHILDTRLLGNYYAAAKAELRFPIGTFLGFPPLRGLFAYDYGAVARRFENLPENIAISKSWGLNLNIPPLSLAFVWSKPERMAPGGEYDKVFHFLVTYLYF